MKQWIALLLVGMAGSAFAEPAQAPHPCRKIEDACKAAGFEQGKFKEKKGLFVDCLKPIMHGQTVPGVSITPADIQACQAKREHKAAPAAAPAANPAKSQ